MLGYYYTFLRREKISSPLCGFRMKEKRGKSMKSREQLLDEVFEVALQNDMTYFG